jgi:two-component system, OmpR family, response regulator
MEETASKRILLVGENNILKYLLRDASEEYDLAIEYAADKEECLAQVSEKEYDLIATDVFASSDEDIELLKKLRAIRPNAKVIVLANESEPEEVIEAMREHAFSYISAPFERSVVKDIVARALDLPVWVDGIEVVSAKLEWITLKLRCHKLTAERLLQFMRELQMDLSEDDRDKIGSAFREMLINAVEHGGNFDPKKRVTLSYLRTSRLIIYRIKDPGEGFTFEELPHSALSNSEDNPVGHIMYRMEQGMRAGGFGIMMSQNLVDELIYNEKGNEVLLIKYLD